MATQVQFRRGTTAETATFTGALGEVTVDVTKDVPVVHDGSTPGGFPSMRENGYNSALLSGSLSSPALKFANSANTGIYSPSPGALGFVCSGVSALSTDSSGNLTTAGNYIGTGSVTGAAFVPTGSSVPTNGFYLPAANTVAIATNNAIRFSVNATGDVSITGTLSLGSSFNAASFVPTGSTVPTNGMYLSATNTIAFATNSILALSIDGSGNIVHATGNLTSSAGSHTARSFIPTSNTIPTNGLYLSSANSISFATNSTSRITVSSTGTTTFLGNATFNPGTAAAPGVNFGGSTTTGLYTPGIGRLGFVTTGVERMQIESTGFVGINVSPVGALLPLTIDGGLTAIRNTIETRVQSDYTGAGCLGTYTNHTLIFIANNSEKMRLDQTGRFGVGTAVLSGLVTVNGDVNAQYYNVSITGTAASVANGLFLPAANTLSITSGSTERIRVKSTGVVRYVTAFTVATLPVGETGDTARVTDANTPTIGSTVTGGGAANALCWYNGTNWTVIGK